MRDFQDEIGLVDGLLIKAYWTTALVDGAGMQVRLAGKEAGAWAVSAR